MKGRLFKDAVSLENNCNGNGCKAVKDFHMIGATCVKAPEDIFDISPFDGVMGLGFPELGVQGTKPLMNALQDEGVLTSSQMLFSFYLKNVEGNSGSRFSIGSIDKSHYNGDITYHDVIPGSKHWSLRLTGLSVGGVDIPLNCPGGACPVVPDTGTSLLTGPSDVVDALSDKIGRVKGDCSNADSLPTIVFRIDNHPYSLSARDYVFRENDKGTDSCFEGFYGMDMPDNLGPNSNRIFILGDSFLRRYFSVFDPQNRRVGFAAASGV
jgi:hypothetical protein